VPKPSSKTFRRGLKVYLVAAALWIPAVAFAHGSIDQANTWTKPPVKADPDSIFSEAQYLVSETHAIVASTMCLQIKMAGGSWGKPPVDYNCVSGRDGPLKGKYQSRFTDCAKDGVYRTRQWAHVEGDDGTVHLKLIGTSSTRTIDC
jgi:hypothetical protein